MPHKIPAPSAAHTPRMEWPAGACDEDATASSAAPTHIISVPPKTPAHRRGPAWRNSRKKTKPQKIPTSYWNSTKEKQCSSQCRESQKLSWYSPPPHASGEPRPDNQVRRALHIGANRRRANNQCGQAPPRDEHANHHDQRDDHRRHAKRNQLCRRLRGSQPRARGESAEYAQRLQLPSP